MTPPSSPDRRVSLDVFRGLTIGAMVLVNNPGSWAAIYDPLEHAAWHGWTFTDTIFPFFLFIVGVAIPMALGKRLSGGGVGPALYAKIARRTLVLFALGLWLAVFPFYNWVKGEWLNLSEVRIMGVLQRIALCYLACSLAFLWLKPRAQAVFTIACLAIYWIAMALGGDWSEAGNLSGLVDRSILGVHMWKGAEHYDPEGLLSTLPAIASTMAGVFCGRWLSQGRPAHETSAGLFMAGFALVLIGWMASAFVPINKPIWTPSYAIFMAGAAFLTLAACHWLIDIRGVTWWTPPFVIFGVNALALFVGSGMLARLFNFVPGGVDAEGAAVSLKTAFHDGVLATLPLGPPENASLVYALMTVGLWLFLMWLLWRKRIFIKI
jgi:predicted acyltransferase